MFYRGSWELGGRFHGGWWQQLPKELRQQIYINDEPTIEEDFSALHLTLLYGIEGLRLDSDPYALDVGWQRDWVKSLILVSINAKNERSAFQAFRSEQPIGSEAKHFTDLELNAVLEAFKLAHPAIAQHLCSDMGVRLMAIDGRITARVIDHFTSLDVPILTIHDSVIAPYNRAIELRAVMREAAAIEASVSSIGIKNTAFNPTDFDELWDLGNISASRIYPKTEGYLHRKQQFEQWIGKAFEGHDHSCLTGVNP